MQQKKAAPVYIAVSDEEKLQLGLIAVREQFVNSTQRNNKLQSRGIPSLSVFQQNKWEDRNNRSIFSWYGKAIWHEKWRAKRVWATQSAQNAEG